MDDAEELTDAARDGPLGLGWEGFDRYGGCVEHEGNTSTDRRRFQENNQSIRLFSGMALGWLVAWEVVATEEDLGATGLGSTRRSADRSEIVCPAEEVTHRTMKDSEHYGVSSMTCSA